MNPEEIIYIKNKIATLGESIGDIQKLISGLKIDRQMLVSSNTPIAPGIACRLTFDSKGLILKGENLRIEDIPELPLEKITGLIRILGNKLEADSVNTIKSKDTNAIRNKIQAGTGLRINYDEDGLIVSSSDVLLLSDIPDLPMEKITGLVDKLLFLESQISNISNEEIIEKTITPGTFPKVTFSSDGKVVSGSKLTIDDIPMDLITKMNTIESRIPLLASQQTVEGLIENVKGKLNSNALITPGVYTKVTVDDKGLITLGDVISIKDLPEIQINNITNLESTLRKKADQKDLIELMNTVASISSNNGSNEFTKLQNELVSKASDQDLKNTINRVDNIQRLVDTLVEKLPSEYIVEQLKQIQEALSTLSGRVASLEQQIKIEDKFCKIPENSKTL